MVLRFSADFLPHSDEFVKSPFFSPWFVFFSFERILTRMIGLLLQLELSSFPSLFQPNVKLPHRDPSFQVGSLSQSRTLSVDSTSCPRPSFLFAAWTQRPPRLRRLPIFNGTFSPVFLVTTGFSSRAIFITEPSGVFKNVLPFGLCDMILGLFFL